MNIALLIFFGAFSLAGSWFVFYKLGYLLKKKLVVDYYCNKVILCYKLSDIEDLIDIYEEDQKSRPFMIVKPEYWKNFK